MKEGKRPGVRVFAAVACAVPLPPIIMYSESQQSPLLTVMTTLQKAGCRPGERERQTDRQTERQRKHANRDSAHTKRERESKRERAHTKRHRQTDRQAISKTYNPECFRCQSGKLKTRSKSFICKSFLDQNSAIVEPLSSPTGTTSTLCHALNTRPGLAPSNARAARVWDLTFVVLAGPGVQVVVHVFVHNPNTAQRELITRTQLRV